MLKFFASLRRMLALERAHVALGEVVKNAIKTIIVPELQSRANATSRPEDREKYEALIRDYAEYADDKNSKSRKWADMADVAFNEKARMFGLDSQVAEEVAQDLAGDFFIKYDTIFRKFNPESGVSALGRYWNTILHQQTISRFREVQRKRSRYETPAVTEEGEEDIFRTMKAPQRETELDQRMYREILGDLTKYVHDKSKSMGYQGKMIPAIFDRWLSLAMDKGADSVHSERDVVIPLVQEMASRGEEAPSRTTMMQAFPIMKKLIAHFFEQELDMRISDAVKKKLRLSSQTVVLYESFRRRLAGWVLSVE